MAARLPDRRTAGLERHAARPQRSRASAARAPGTAGSAARRPDAAGLPERRGDPPPAAGRGHLPARRAGPPARTGRPPAGPAARQPARRAAARAGRERRGRGRRGTTVGGAGSPAGAAAGPAVRQPVRLPRGRSGTPPAPVLGQPGDPPLSVHRPLRRAQPHLAGGAPGPRPAGRQRAPARRTERHPADGARPAGDLPGAAAPGRAPAGRRLSPADDDGALRRRRRFP
ncbi:hypothetical protein OF001_U80071 [Pseudomonas sp. OF001]|nr:hypothetical protein OF001_U80071 [Pseudomonas sp. OF001]